MFLGIRSGVVQSESGAAPPFNPSSVSGLKLWLDADDATTITEVAGRCSQWDDKALNNGDVLQGTAVNQPFTGSRTKNGKNVMDFQKGEFMRSGNFTTSIPQPRTLYLVSKFDSLQTTDFFLDGITFTERMRIGTAGSSSFRFRADTELSSTADTIDHLFKVELNTTSSNVYIDGSLVVSGNIGSDGLTGITVAEDFNGSTGELDGYIAEVLIYDSIITGTDDTNIQNYLNTKWGL